MGEDRVSATALVAARPEDVFRVLADPTRHAAIDGTGWVCEALDRQPLTAAGQLFRMAMYHPQHPDGGYRTVNRVQVYDPPSTISWEPGHYTDDGTVGYGGWIWRYDLAPAGTATTRVTLTYDWSVVSDDIRAYLEFPPFGPDHLSSSLAHLAQLATS